MISEEQLKAWENSDTDNYMERIAILIADVRALRKVAEAAKIMRIYCLGNDASTENMLERFDSAITAWEHSNGSK